MTTDGWQHWMKSHIDVAFKRVHNFDFISATTGWMLADNRTVFFPEVGGGMRKGEIITLLKPYGRAAVVVPDNVLFEGGAGEKIREDLLKTCDVHTLLRLPVGIFYAQGVKANVLFFDRMPGSDKPQTRELWIYDFRTNQNFTLRTNPLKREYLEDFVQCFNAGDKNQRKETERFRKFSYDELLKRDKLNLDIFWLRDENLEDSENLPTPDILGKSIIEDLTAALEQFKSIVSDLGGIEDIEEEMSSS